MTRNSTMALIEVLKALTNVDMNTPAAPASAKPAEAVPHLRDRYKNVRFGQRGCARALRA